MENLVLFQVGNLDIAYEILNYIQHFIINYNVFFIFSLLDSFKLELQNFIHNLNKFNITKYHIMFHINKGMDIGPYLKQLQYVFYNYKIESFNQIYKIHTKTNIIWRNELLDSLLNQSQDVSNKWKLSLDKLNVFHINEICTRFNINNIFYDELSTVNYDSLNENDIDIDFYINYYNIKLNNCDHLSNLFGYDINRNYLFYHCKNNLNIPNQSYIITKRHNLNIKFIAGTIFVVDYKYVWNFFSKINLDELYDLLEEGYSTNEKSTYVHAMERIISGFVYMY